MPYAPKSFTPRNASTGGTAPAQAPRPNATTRGYDWTWYNLARRHRKRFPNCQRCKARPSPDPDVKAFPVDHVIPVLVAPHRRLDPSNLMTLCPRCHGLKTEADKKRYPYTYRKH